MLFEPWLWTSEDVSLSDVSFPLAEFPSSMQPEACGAPLDDGASFKTAIFKLALLMQSPSDGKNSRHAFFSSVSATNVTAEPSIAVTIKFVASIVLPGKSE